MTIKAVKSPNFTERRGADRPDMVVLHYTAMVDAAAALDRLCDPVAEVSAHYLIDPSGGVVRLVDETQRAWHAGRSHWGAIDDVNSHSIGIELANPGHHDGWPPYPHGQTAALEDLLAGIQARWAIPAQRVVGHACIAPGRKIDPGEKLDWRRLARARLSVWLDPPGPAGDADADRFRDAARRFGYPVPEGHGWGPALIDLWHAYAMRFLPGRVDHRRPDAAGVAHLERLADCWPVQQMRYLVVRVPSVGPSALAGPPNDFPTRDAAETRIAEIRACGTFQPHTTLRVFAFIGDKHAVLDAAGILY